MWKPRLSWLCDSSERIFRSGVYFDLFPGPRLKQEGLRSYRCTSVGIRVDDIFVFVFSSLLNTLFSL